eukprot:TRINITY_DN42612_c0_g1_i1.p1 TRINITY_DN42612_c0_g1~~TRINITY_DN42612_c0_g1_i1.p1  ORF type:complete len:307 (-),score=83.99 TRINITY_DN42612_c0_g1_i1:196-1035(-)
MEKILADLEQGFIKAGLDEDDLDKKMKIQRSLQPELQGALQAAGLQHLGSEAATWSTMQVGVKTLADVAKKVERLTDYLDLEGDDAERLKAAVTGSPMPKPPAATTVAAKKSEAAAPAKVVVEGPIRPPRAQRTCMTAAPDLLWQCMQKSSSFTRKGGVGPIKTFSAEPANLMGLHSFQFSGLASEQAIDVRPVMQGSRETVQLVQSHAKVSTHRRPSACHVTTGLKKSRSQGEKKLETELLARFYRPGMHGLARLKYLKVLRSFKKKKAKVSSRRSKQ